MNKGREKHLPELREFVKENAERLNTFCYYLLQEEHSVEDVLLDIFRRFGEIYRRHAGKQESGWEAIEMRIRLYRLGWERTRDELSTFSFQWASGRDTRALKKWDENLLAKESRRQHEGEPGGFEGAVLERLRLVDADLRAAIVLRDILSFEDEEVVRILGIRWGVYRHRLHRGRIELRDALKGQGISGVLPQVPSVGIRVSPEEL